MGIQAVISYFSRFPSWGGAPPKSYLVPYTLESLRPGLDNVHYDVHISPFFSMAISDIVFPFLVKHAEVDGYLDKNAEPLGAKKDDFKNLCAQLLIAGMEKAARSPAGVQLDYLAQTVLVNFLLNEIRTQFQILIEKFNGLVWEKETVSNQDLLAVVALKEKISALRQQRKLIIYNTSKELFRYLLEVQREKLNPLRKQYFGEKALLPDEFFNNPILFQGSRLEDLMDDYVMIEEYVLLGRRTADPNTYDVVLALFKGLIEKIKLDPRAADEDLDEGTEKPFWDVDEKDTTMEHQQRDGWLKHPATIDILFDFFQTEARLAKEPVGKFAPEERKTDKKRGEEQKKILQYCYKEFDRQGLINIITVAGEMKTVYRQYCPPLLPQQLLQVLLNPKTATDVEAQLKRVVKNSANQPSLDSLKSFGKDLARLTVAEKQRHLIGFLKGFVRYHRDLGNFNILRALMDKVRLVADAQSRELSRVNNTLYEFLLPQERNLELDERPVTGHVGVKVNLAGIAAISREIHAQGLQPVGYLIQHFYEPIFRVASKAAALKIIAEQDCVILAMVERENENRKNFMVARACGLVLKILMIMQRFNAENEKQQLPFVRADFGIGFEPGAPVFLPDQGRKMVVSGAISSAAQLSEGEWPIPKYYQGVPAGYNFFVYQECSDGEAIDPVGPVRRNYTRNGIGLSPAAFAKLSAEVSLEAFVCDLPEFLEEGSILYKAQFTSMSGKPRFLIIRESRVRKVDPENNFSVSLADEKFYELCRQPRLYAYVKGER